MGVDCNEPVYFACPHCLCFLCYDHTEYVCSEHNKELVIFVIDDKTGKEIPMAWELNKIELNQIHPMKFHLIHLNQTQYLAGHQLKLIKFLHKAPPVIYWIK